ncbi:MAG: TlpA disulfide reductase family protein [Candidatus Eisenbacteria bacterium]
MRTWKIFLLAGLFAAGCGGGGKEESGALKAPEFSLSTVSGDKTIGLADYKGKVLIVDFWATWCPPCKREIPHFNELYAEYKSKGLEILGVSVDQGGVSAVEQYMASSAPSLKPAYPVVMADAKVQAAYGPIGSIPTTFVIDRKGNVQQRVVGYQDKEFFELILKELL